jgi:hypothetical protein
MITGLRRGSPTLGISFAMPESYLGSPTPSTMLLTVVNST